MSQVGCPPVSTPLAQVLKRIAAPPLVCAAPTERCESCVIVPVRDEAELLEQTLAALAGQCTPTGVPLDPRSYEIIVLANNCRDDSAAVARRFASTHPYLRLHTVELTLSPAEAHVGRARQLLMDEAYRRLYRVGQPRGVIASTDGDSQVCPHWLFTIRSEICKGADAVGGRIFTHPTERAALDPATRLCLLRDAGYQYLASYLQACIDPDPFDPWPRHYQHFGASFAVTAEAYGR